MNFTSRRKLISAAMGLFAMIIIASPAVFMGCQGEMEQFQGVSSTSDFSVLMVPDTNLDVYLYAKQKSLTTIPANLINMQHDIQVESLAIWGVPSDEDMAFGLGLTFDNPITAEEVDGKLANDSVPWKLLRENNLYIVQGTGSGADTLKTAIQNNNFVFFNNAKLIEAANMLPNSVKAKLIGIALAQPSTQLINFIANNVSAGTIEQINEILRLANLELVIAGLYSPHQINISRAVQVIQGDGNLANLDLGLLVSVKSGLPGILVEPRVRDILEQQGFQETTINDTQVFKGMWSNPYSTDIPVFARIEGNYVFMAISGQESYAETLITSIYK